MERSSDHLRELLAQYSEVLANLSGALAASAEEDQPQVEQGLGQPGDGNDESPVTGSSLRQRRRRQRPTGAQPGDEEPVEAPEPREQASGEDPAPQVSNMPAVNEGAGQALLPAFDQGRIAIMRGLIVGVRASAETIQAVACELRVLSERIGGAGRSVGREHLALDEQAQAIRDLTIAMTVEARAAARLAGTSR